MNPKLIRKYRIVKPTEPIQMFDWFTGSDSICEGYPEPNEQYNNGWVQIRPDNYEHMLDGNPSNREGYKIARFIDCVPVSQSTKV